MTVVIQFKVHILQLFFHHFFLYFQTFQIVTTRYLLRGYFLGVLMHTTALDRHWGGDITLCKFKIFCQVESYITNIHHSSLSIHTAAVARPVVP